MGFSSLNYMNTTVFTFSESTYIIAILSVHHYIYTQNSLLLLKPVILNLVFLTFNIIYTHSSTLKGDTGTNSTEKMYKPSFAGFVDVHLADGKISLRSLVCYKYIHFYSE